MLTVIGSFLGSILLMGMDSAQSMYFFKLKKEGHQKQAQIVSSILQWRLISGAIIVIFSTAISPVLNTIFFGGKLHWEYFLVSFSGVLFIQITSQSAEVMRLLFRPWSYILVVLSQSVLAAAIALTLILKFNQGILGFFWGGLVASLLVAAIGWFRVRSYLRFDKLHFDLWPMLLRFGLPLVPASLAMYFMNTSDRWFIQHYHGDDALGLYAVGAKFAMLSSLAIETFRKAWWPLAMDSMHSEDGEKTFIFISNWYVCSGSLFILILTFLSPWLVEFITGPNFHDSWPIVGILTWKGLLYGYFMICSAGIWKAEKTYLNLYISLSILVVGLILNFLIVPTYGIVGASVATVFTFFIWIVITSIVSNFHWRIKFNYFFIISVFIISLTISYSFSLGYL
jgi:O-antigen/teichoic acid export membrane protein